MAGERLIEFDIDLGEYVLGQVRPHLRALPGRHVRPLVPLDYDGFHRLTMDEWVGRGVAALPAPLADHVWAGVVGEPARRFLSDAELVSLAVAMNGPPLRCEAECVWEPYPTLHARSVECVPEVREALTRQTAEEWAAASAAFAGRLCEEGLSLAEGIGVVHEWLWHLRRLLRVMGAAEVLQIPPGTDPTPTHPNPGPTPLPRRMSRSGQVSATNPATDGGGAEGPVMLSPARITAKYAVSRSTVYAACRSGLLPHYRVPARKGARGKYLVREDDLRAWLESVRVGPGSPAPSTSAPASSGSPAGLFSELNPERLARAWKAG